MLKRLFTVFRRPATQARLFEKANQLAAQGEKKEALALIENILNEDSSCKPAMARRAVLTREIKADELNRSSNAKPLNQP